MSTRVYVARKDCGCIVAAFPVNLDKAIKGSLMMVLAKAGFDIEQTTQGDVRANFHLTCDHNKPPLLAYMDERTAEGRMAVACGEGITVAEGGEGPAPEGDGQSLEEEHSFDDDDPDFPLTAERPEAVSGEELGEGSDVDDDGIDMADVNALASDVTPEAELADELISQEEF